MKKRIILTLVILVSIGFGILIGTNFNNEKTYTEDKPKQIKNEKTLSMMLEQTAGAGDYEMTTASTWPTEGYIFNTTLSKCTNGGELAWDDTKKVVTISGNTSDKCFVYFDKLPPSKVSDVCSGGENLAGCIKTLFDKGDSSNTNIYYHDLNLTNGAGDNSYRYAGASSSVNNYVCFGSTDATCPTDNLYRIIGVFGNQVKLIKSTSYTDMGWDSNNKNTWSTASLNTYLNGTYLTSLGTYASKIAQTTWKVGGNTLSNIVSQIPSVAYQNEIVYPVTTNTKDNKTEYSAKIGLMYVSDYGFAADPAAWTTTLDNYIGSVNGSTIKSLNWMYLGSDEWTILRESSSYWDVIYVEASGGFGEIGSSQIDAYNVCNAQLRVRPSFYLISSITYSSGSGTSSDPIRIN